MAENCIIPSDQLGRIQEAVCIDTKRIYDSCVSKDCLEDLRVTFSSRSQRLIDEALLVKCRDCEVLSVSIDLEEVPFNRGFYSVDITYFYKLKFDTYKCVNGASETAVGFAVFSKKCILYGGDGNVKIFSSSYVPGKMDNQDTPRYCNPSAKVQLVDPVVLSTNVIECCDCRVPCCTCFPTCVTSCIDDSLATSEGKKAVLVTLGQFSIVQMERDVQLLVPAYDYCIPDHECCCDSENPCDTFSKIAFPIDEFFPRDPASENGGNGSGCCGSTSVPTGANAE